MLTSKIYHERHGFTTAEVQVVPLHGAPRFAVLGVQLALFLGRCGETGLSDTNKYTYIHIERGNGTLHNKELVLLLARAQYFFGFRLRKYITYVYTYVWCHYDVFVPS